MSETKSAYEPVITDESLALLKRSLGYKVPIRPNYDIATPEAIMRVAYANGDDNPLWTDPDYAATSKYGGLVASPSYLLSCISGPLWPRLREYTIPDDMPKEGVQLASGLPGVPNWYVGDEWEWWRLVRPGDAIKALGGLYSVTELPRRDKAKDPGRAVEVVWETIFTNQRGERVGRYLYKQWKRELPQSPEKQRQLFEAPVPHYTDADLRRIEQDCEREEIRRSLPRFWEDVQVGEKLAPVVKGPLSITDVVTWLMYNGWRIFSAHKFRYQWQNVMVSHKEEFDTYHTALHRNQFGTYDGIEATHWDYELVQSLGLPRPYDIGPQRMGYFTQLCTNWCGDDGFLRRLTTEVRRPWLVGDTGWCRGEVVDKRVEEGEHVVDLRLWIETQAGETNTRGEATVRLPSSAAASS